MSAGRKRRFERFDRSIRYLTIHGVNGKCVNCARVYSYGYIFFFKSIILFTKRQFIWKPYLCDYISHTQYIVSLFGNMEKISF